MSVIVTDEPELILGKQVLLTSLLFNAGSCGDSFRCRREERSGFNLLKCTYTEIHAIMHLSFHFKNFGIGMEISCF